MIATIATVCLAASTANPVLGRPTSITCPNGQNVECLAGTENCYDNSKVYCKENPETVASYESFSPERKLMLFINKFNFRGGEDSESEEGRQLSAAANSESRAPASLYDGRQLDMTLDLWDSNFRAEAEADATRRLYSANPVGGFAAKLPFQRETWQALRGLQALRGV